jgi:hypothetical protein
MPFRHVTDISHFAASRSLILKEAVTESVQAGVPDRLRAAPSKKARMSDKETRRYPRYKGIKPVPVAWMQGTQKAVAKAENLSLGGLFIKTPTPPPIGALVQLLFHTPEGEVRVRATVRNVKPGTGMGLAITSMEQDHRARLSRWLQLLAKQAETAEPVAAI